MITGNAAQLLAILPLEAAVGYPQALVRHIGHPVIGIGRLIAVVELYSNRGPALRRRVTGVGLVIVLVLVAGGTGALMSWLAGNGPGIVALIIVATTGIAQRSLHDHVAAVARPLAAGDVLAAREAVARIVGRDSDALDESGVATAAIESLAESFCDGVVAPALWFLVAGLPGLAICKAINTADSIVGHKDARHLDFGWASARADDLVNLIPARFSGLLICIAGAGGWHVMLRDARHHASPNGGWPEAAMAGVLGRRLGGPVTYDGEPAARAFLGKGMPPSAQDIGRALGVYRRACVLLWLTVGVGAILWLR